MNNHLWNRWKRASMLAFPTLKESNFINNLLPELTVVQDFDLVDTQGEKKAQLSSSPSSLPLRIKKTDSVIID